MHHYGELEQQDKLRSREGFLPCECSTAAQRSHSLSPAAGFISIPHEFSLLTVRSAAQTAGLAEQQLQQN